MFMVNNLVIKKEWCWQYDFLSLDFNENMPYLLERPVTNLRLTLGKVRVPGPTRNTDSIQREGYWHKKLKSPYSIRVIPLG